MPTNRRWDLIQGLKGWATRHKANLHNSVSGRAILLQRKQLLFAVVDSAAGYYLLIII